MNITSTRVAPTSEEITAARKWVRKQFPYAIEPSYSPGQGHLIFKFMEETFGPCDVCWTYLEPEVLFKTEEDRAAFLLSWGKWED